MFSRPILLIYCLYFVRNVYSYDSLSCVDDNGDPVDWFYAYKSPRVHTNPNKLVDNGLGYIYITSNTLNYGWRLSEKSVNDSTSMMGNTLEPLYNNDQNVAAITFNDEVPSAKRKSNFRFKSKFKSSKFQHHNYKKHYKMTGGHTKGVILADLKSGIWLVHSVPKFPPNPSPGVGYSYPHTALKFGQTFLCLTLTSETLNNISKQLWYNEPDIRYSLLPSALLYKYDNLLKLVEDKFTLESPWYHSLEFSTVQGTKFLSFAKSSNFNDDLYSGLVAPALKSNLLVETWRNEAGALASNCSKTFKVFNIDEINMNAVNLNFSFHNDHSKWCIADSISNTQWVCVGDINRALPQEKRGGGTVCTTNAKLWKQFFSIIQTSDNCQQHDVIQV